MHTSSGRRIHGPLAVDGVELAALLNGEVRVAGGRKIRGAAIDSRLVGDTPGCAFFALPGARTDGRLHAVAALHAGAAAVVISRADGSESAEVAEALRALDDAAKSAGASVVVVPNALHALGAAATAWRARFDLEVIGVTGSVGKTTTKQFITAALGGVAEGCYSTPGNANNEIGLPLALLNLPDEATRFVAEMGMYVLGDIRSLCAIAQPRIGVVTAVDAVHAERAGGIAAIESGKGELIAALPADGQAILAADDPRVVAMGSRGPARVRTAGRAADADVAIRDAHLIERSSHTSVLLATTEGEVQLELPVFGAHFAQAAALAIAVAQACGVSARIAGERLHSASLPSGRATTLFAGGVRIIDDTYNAAPRSMAAALATLAACTGQRFAVLGAMGELGDGSAAAHEAIGRTAASSELAMLIVIGSEADGIAEGARAGGMSVEQILRLPADAAGLAAAAGMLGDRVAPGSTILVKASRSVGLERLVETLMKQLGGVTQ